MTAYKPKRIAELVRELREEAVRASAPHRAEHADQLEAAVTEVEYWKRAAIRTANGQRMDLSSASHANLTECGDSGWLLENSDDTANAFEDADVEAIKRTAERDALRAENARLCETAAPALARVDVASRLRRDCRVSVFETFGCALAALRRINYVWCDDDVRESLTQVRSALSVAQSKIKERIEG